MTEWTGAKITDWSWEDVSNSEVSELLLSSYYQDVKVQRRLRDT